MFGYHSVPFIVEKDSVSLSVGERDGSFSYRRMTRAGQTEKTFLTRPQRVLLCPVEPLNVPKRLASHLLIEFTERIIVEPRTSAKLYLTFPVEIGVFIAGKGEEIDSGEDLLDVLSAGGSKLTVYGDISSGILCRYWKSTVSLSAPEVNCLEEGVLELSVTSRTNEWAEISRVVFSAEQMNIFFSPEMVLARAMMNIIGEGLAETEFDEHTPRPDMKPAVKLFASRRIPVITTGFVMEWGL